MHLVHDVIFWHSKHGYAHFTHRPQSYSTLKYPGIQTLQ